MHVLILSTNPCHMLFSLSLLFFFFFNDPPTTEIYTLSLHDALPISAARSDADSDARAGGERPDGRARSRRTRDPTRPAARRDRKSTRLNSSHTVISYAVFCLKKKKKKKKKHKTRKLTKQQTQEIEEA